MEGRVEMEAQQRFFRGLTLGQAGFCTSSSPTCVHTHSADTPGPKVQIEALPDFRIKHAYSLYFSGLPVAPTSSDHPSPFKAVR